MVEEKRVYSILDRPWGLRIIGLLQMSFGIFGLIATTGIIGALILGGPGILDGMGYIYALLIFGGVTLPCLIIGNYVDDLRRNAVIAQIIYSIIAIILCGVFLSARGFQYLWTVPVFEMELVIAISNLAIMIVLTQTFIVFYLFLNWDKVVPTDDAVVIRDRAKAKRLEIGFVPSPLEPSLLGADGSTVLSDEDTQRILDVRRIVTEEGMAVLCSNCSGATPLSKAQDNKLVCDYCGVTLGISGVFVPCENHPEYLAATTCSVCGDHYCRNCLTAQEPPIDERWKGSTIFLCKTCFEGRYRPAVTTTSFVIPIDQLFSTAGARFSTVGRIYRRFLGAYGGVIKALFRLPLDLVASFGKSGGSSGGGGSCTGGGGGGGGGSGGSGDGDSCLGIIFLIILIIVAIPIIAGLILLVGAIIIIPFLFYAGLIAVTIEAIKVIRRTDFQSLDSVRIQSVIEKKKPKVKESTMRPITRNWEDEYESFARAERMRREEKRRKYERSRDQRPSIWDGGRSY